MRPIHHGRRRGLKKRGIRISGCRDLWIPEDSTSGDTINSATAQIRFLKSHWNDIVHESSAIRATLELLAWEPESVVDAMAGCGFSAAQFASLWPKAKLTLNDFDEQCANVLRDNFPECDVYQEDVRIWDMPRVDLCFIDFNNFTLKRLGDWKDYLKVASSRCRWLIFADAASYGFHMGNLKVYGVNSPEDYYRKLNGALYKTTKKRIVAVSIFGNAALVFCRRSPKVKIAFVDYGVPLAIRWIKGFGL